MDQQYSDDIFVDNIAAVTLSISDHNFHRIREHKTHVMGPDTSIVQSSLPESWLAKDEGARSLNQTTMDHMAPARQSESTSTELAVFTGSMGPPAKSRKKKAPTLRESDWQPYKARVVELHIKERRPLPEVRLVMERDYGFTAEIRQYRARISQWKLDKNVKSDEMKAIVRKRQRRKLVEVDKGDLIYRVRGQTVEPQKIDRWMKRHDVLESKTYSPSSAACQLYPV